MVWIAQVSYNTAKPKAERSAYRTAVFELTDSDAPPTGRLSQIGPVENDTVRYVGSYATEADANAALEQYVAAP